MVLMTFVLSIEGCCPYRRPAGTFEVQYLGVEESAGAKKKPIVYAANHRDLNMYVAVPKNTSSRRPAVILFHGGAWHFGDPSYMRNLAESLASLGYVAASAEYRLVSNRVRFPDPVLDAIAAVKFIKKEAEQFNVNPEKIAVLGESSGGHLALLVAYAAEKDAFKDPRDPYPNTSARVSAVVSLHGPTDLAKLHEHLKLGVTRGGLERFLDGTPESAAGTYTQASPITYVRAGIPPTLLVHGKSDRLVPYKQATDLHEKIIEAEAPCKLAPLPKVGHPMGPLFSSCEGMRYLPVIVQFLSQVFDE